MNPLLALSECGQFLWLDHISRRLITGGGLQRLVDDDGLGGVTSNPTIFAKAIANSTDYDAQLHRLLDADGQVNDRDLAERLIVEDIQQAADVLRPVHAGSGGANGFVSIEVSPGSAHDTDATVAEARHLWQIVGRPNVMIKVPATVEGIPAVEVLTAEGININITLMFSLEHYEAVAQAYLRGLARCPDPHGVTSVASVFVSRLDVVADRLLEAIGSPDALALRGRIAIANAKRVYRRFGEIFGGEPFAALKRRGGRVQRPLWASTGTKNPSYSDVLYLEALIRAGDDYDRPANDDGCLSRSRAGSRHAGNRRRRSVTAAAASLCLDIHALTEALQADAHKAFASSFDQLLATVAQKRRHVVAAAS
jgi:transaldolase